MRYEDTEFDPATDADREAAAREAELARKIRREVLRVQRGEADDDLRADREAEQQERAARMERRRKSSFLWLLFSGNILVRESFSGYYRYLIYMAVTFFVSIFVMFTALHLDMKYTRLEREVQLLRERSVRLQEQSFRSTTHSAVVRALAERGIPLYAPAAPGDIIEEGPCRSPRKTPRSSATSSSGCTCSTPPSS